MRIQHGKGTTRYGPGVILQLEPEEVAIAIHAWVVGQGVHIQGPRTTTVNGEPLLCGQIYVDPSGFVITADGRKVNGRGSAKNTTPR